MLWGGEKMTIKQLDEKYSFSRRKAGKNSKLSYSTVINFFSGNCNSIRTAKAIINVLPITPEERSSLIESMFAPDEKD